MSDLTGRTQNDTYKDLLHFENSNLGFDGTLRQIESGNGVGSTLSLSTVGAAIAGTLSVAGIAAFGVTPNVAGNEMWHAGNDGPGSGLDADTLQGILPSAFLTTTSNATITGAWNFTQSLLHSAANNVELERYLDTSNNIQMAVSFDTNLDFSLTPGTAGIPDPTSSFFYDSDLTRWSTNTDFAINKVNGKLYINTAGGQVPVMSVEPTLGDGVLLGDAAFNTFMTSDDGLFHLLGNNPGEFHAGLVMQDGAVIEGRMGYFDDFPDQLLIESLASGGGGIFMSTDGLELVIESQVGDILIDSAATIDLFALEEIFLSSNLDIILTGGGEVELDNGNGLAFITTDPTLLASTSSAVIKDGSDIIQYVGFNGMPSINFAANTSLLSANVGYKLNYTGAVVSALSISGDANIPNGATWVGANLGTIPFTVDTTGITLNWLDGGGVVAPTGTRTIAVSGIFTLTKRATGVYDIWGAGIT